MAVDEERELVRSLPHHQPGAKTRGPGTERPVRPVLPHGGAADRREDRAGASSASSPTTPGWTGCHSRACGSDTWRLSTLSASTASTATGTRRARPRLRDCPTPASSLLQKTRWVFRSAPPSPRWSGRPTTRPPESVGFRHLWGQSKREELTEEAEAAPESLYEAVGPVLPLGLPFAEVAANRGWSDWPSLPDLFPTSFPGVKTSRDSFLVDVDLERLKERVVDYFNPAVSHEEMVRRHPDVMDASRIYDARAVRDTLLKRGGPLEAGFVRHAYRPFDTRWLYWEADSKLLDRPRPDYLSHVRGGNLWLGSNKREIDNQFSHGTLVHHLGNWKLGNWGIHFFPAWLRDEGLRLEGDGFQRRPNLSPAAQGYLDRLGLGVEDLFHHILAVLHDPAYREANAGALRMEWPRIPHTWLARWRLPWSGRRTGCLGRTGSGTGPPAGLRKHPCLVSPLVISVPELSDSSPSPPPATATT